MTEAVGSSLHVVYLIAGLVAIFSLVFAPSEIHLDTADASVEDFLEIGAVKAGQLGANFIRCHFLHLGYLGAHHPAPELGIGHIAIPSSLKASIWPCMTIL